MSGDTLWAAPLPNFLDDLTGYVWGDPRRMLQTLMLLSRHPCRAGVLTKTPRASLERTSRHSIQQ